MPLNGYDPASSQWQYLAADHVSDLLEDNLEIEIGTINLLDCLATLGFKLAPIGVDSNPASDAYINAMSGKSGLKAEDLRDRRAGLR